MADHDPPPIMACPSKFKDYRFYYCTIGWRFKARKYLSASRPGPNLKITTYDHDCPQAVLFVASVVQIRSMILQWTQEVIDEK